MAVVVGIMAGASDRRGAIRVVAVLACSSVLGFWPPWWCSLRRVARLRVHLWFAALSPSVCGSGYFGDDCIDGGGGSVKI